MKSPEIEPLFSYDLIDTATGEVLDSRWLTESDRSQRQSQLRSNNQTWEMSTDAQPRWEVAQLLMALCSFYWDCNLDQFWAAIPKVVPENATTQRVESLYMQYLDCAAKLNVIRPEMLAAVAMAYYNQQKLPQPKAQPEPQRKQRRLTGKRRGRLRLSQ